MKAYVVTYVSIYIIKLLLTIILVVVYNVDLCIVVRVAKLSLTLYRTKVSKLQSETVCEKCEYASTL